MLELRLFGPFEARAGGRPVTLTSARGQALLACLALSPDRPVRRELVAGRLWPDSTEPQARTNLRHLLHTLRATPVDPYLVATAQTLTLRDTTADVAAFGPDDRAAAEAYRGDLLEGSDDEWLAPVRDEYRRRVLAALGRLVPKLEADGEIEAAIRYAERARALDRLAETPYRWLIRLHDAHGDRARAVRVYHECVAVLDEELGVPPADETRAAYEALLPHPEPAVKSAVAGYVGRAPERKTLAELWRATRDPHLVVVTGEPGIGKTRLVDEFRHAVSRQPGAVTAAARSYAAEGALAYAPVAAWLRDLGIARWRSRLTRPHLAALAALLPELEIEPDPDSRLRLFEAAARALRGGPGPVLLIADDLHAADPVTCQFLHYLLRSDGPAPLLVAATARTAETDPGQPLPALLTALRALGRCTELPLGRLDRAETAALAGRLGRPLSTLDADRLHAETEGSPLFVVEALRAGWPPALTPAVQAVLQARLAQLSPGARDLIGVAAAAGNSASVDVLARVHPGDIAGDLDELWRRQLLLTTGGDRYDFSHDKLREVAYAALSPIRRRQHHRALAEAVAQVDPDRPGEVAGHLRAAGAKDEAVIWYLRAAVAAQRVYADAEAAGLLDQAAALVPGTPRELEVLTALPGPLAAAEGYASPRLRAALDRAFGLAGELGVVPDAPLIRAQAMAVLSRGEFATARQYGAQLCERDTGDDLLAVEGHFVQGVAAAWRNETDAAREHLRAAIDRYRPANRAAHLRAYGQDPRVLCLARLAHVEFCRGDAGSARRWRAKALAEAAETGHPFSTATATLFAAMLDLDLGDDEALRADVAGLRKLRPRVEAIPIRLSADALTGYLEVRDGSTTAGIARIDAALADPGRFTAPGLPAMLWRIRLAAAGDPGSKRALLDSDVRVWDAVAER